MAVTETIATTDLEFARQLGQQLRVDSIRCSTAAASGHPTSSMSAAHLVAVLYSDHLRLDVDDPKSPANDRFILSKGHASPLLFSAGCSVSRPLSSFATELAASTDDGRVVTQTRPFDPLSSLPKLAAPTWERSS